MTKCFYSKLNFKYYVEVIKKLLIGQFILLTRQLRSVYARSPLGNLLEEIEGNVQVNINLVNIENYYGIRISTTYGSTIKQSSNLMTVDWAQHDIPLTTSKICCPTVDTVKVNSFIQCINIGERCTILGEL